VNLRVVFDFDAFCERLFYEFALRPPARVSPETHLVTDLACDSLLLLEIVLFVEDLAGAAFPEAQIAGIETLGDLFGAYSSGATT
jgi:acyl carrier protein